jgi:hypothetical protein
MWAAFGAAFLYAGISAFQLHQMKIATDKATISADAAKRSADTAVSELKLSHRPWVNVTVQAITPLVFNAQGMQITIRFRLKNIGNSPAIKTIINAKLETVWDEAPIIPAWKQLCEELKNGVLANLLGNTLFPGDYAQQNITFSISRPVIEASLEPHSRDLINLTIVGGIDYQFSFAAGHHQTRFIYDIRRTKPSLPTASFIIQPSIGTLPIEQIRISQHFPVGSEAD